MALVPDGDVVEASADARWRRGRDRAVPAGVAQPWSVSATRAGPQRGGRAGAPDGRTKRRPVDDVAVVGVGGGGHVGNLAALLVGVGGVRSRRPVSADRAAGTCCQDGPRSPPSCPRRWRPRSGFHAVSTGVRRRHRDQRRAADPGHVGLVGRVVDRQLGGPGRRLAGVAVARARVARGGEHALTLGRGLREQRRTPSPARPGSIMRLALAPAGGQHLGRVLVHHGR